MKPQTIKILNGSTFIHSPRELIGVEYERIGGGHIALLFSLIKLFVNKIETLNETKYANTVLNHALLFRLKIVLFRRLPICSR
jgi:hypothetical protein